MHTEAGSLPSPAPSPLRAAFDYVAEIWGYRHFWFSLVQADLRRRYRRSLLGVGWSLLQPIIMTVVLCLVYSRLLDTDFTKFGPLLLTGFAVWNYVHGAALQGKVAAKLAPSRGNEPKLISGDRPLKRSG